MAHNLCRTHNKRDSCCGNLILSSLCLNGFIIAINCCSLYRCIVTVFVVVFRQFDCQSHILTERKSIHLCLLTVFKQVLHILSRSANHKINGTVTLTLITAILEYDVITVHAVLMPMKFYCMYTLCLYLTLFKNKQCNI